VFVVLNARLTSQSVEERARTRDWDCEWPSKEGLRSLSQAIGRLIPRFPVVISKRLHPIPSRTRKLSSSEPMVLHGKPCGRVGRCRDLLQAEAIALQANPLRIAKRVSSFVAHGAWQLVGISSEAVGRYSSERRHPTTEGLMAISKASAHWEGGLKDGKGSMKPAHAGEAPYSFGSRFEGQPSSNPEELIGAALAGCYSMALSGALERAELKPKSIHTSADVHLEKQADGFTITAIDLTTVANVPGADNAKFQEVAEATKKTCPVSRALAAKISLKASLST
jgi:lipoyl-dependent peroxiredoxin